jgi:hypothetical protein
MPTPQSADTNRFRCEFCGRHFNTEDELRSHQPECRAAHQAAHPHEDPKAAREEGEDRDWVSTP